MGLGKNIISYFDNSLYHNYRDGWDNKIFRAVTLFFQEVARVLKKGGILITKTPNLYHYMPTIARLTPFAFHDFYGRLLGRPSHDTFPTFYRVNTKQKQKYYAEKAGFQIESMQILEARPEYLRFNALTYTVGILYERAVNLLRLDSLKIVIYTVYKKS
ncbi:MAG: hypothetical protein LH618_08140 [Saprospiraceae bacterium]|nr:hypothetical protein [Saprospiraceae bacterium]